MKKTGAEMEQFKSDLLESVRQMNRQRGSGKNVRETCANDSVKTFDTNFVEEFQDLLKHGESAFITQAIVEFMPKRQPHEIHHHEITGVNLLRAVVSALCYMRDVGYMCDIGDVSENKKWFCPSWGRRVYMERIELSLPLLIEHLELPKVEWLYLLGYRESLENKGDWSHGFIQIKKYLEYSLPGYDIFRLLVNNSETLHNNFVRMMKKMPDALEVMSKEQEPVAIEQHGWRNFHGKNALFGLQKLVPELGGN